MFIDSVKIIVKSGDGGGGASTFRREKYIPEGGPSGGDGGRGGDILVVADSNQHTLMDYRYRKVFKADNGENGQNKNRHGKAADSLVLRVPPGTVIFLEEAEIVIADLINEGDHAVLARGGRGGRGNARFATAVIQAPTYCEKGEAGQELKVRLELKSIADVGLVGFPNAGKSTLLSVVSAAKPKIGDYPFTTLSPNLGVVAVGGRSFVMADIPGIIEGAHTGLGLGLEFLRHIERTRILIYVVDAAGTDGRDPLEDVEVLDREISQYSSVLATRPKIIALNKIDAITDPNELNCIQKTLSDKGWVCFPISAVVGEGLSALLHYALDLIDKTAVSPIHVIEKAPPASEEDRNIVVTEEDGIFIVQNKGIERLILRTNLDNEDAVDRLQLILRKLGVFSALREAGIAEGQSVKIGTAVFSFFDEEPE